MESFSKSALIDDLIVEKFLRFALIFERLSPTSQMDLIRMSVSIESNCFMDSSEV